ncbi:MAG: isopentenyl-diphosphate Delta-isomerase [Daejeonella sp.]|uniref:isopentenyl-diphosphate Delta-isomerase n=1 Tax=Daejeonella sp. TaxID=2805397 RepID=UPI002733D76F|nr:isopentenyl-diphosphate Delta-isomerase [Daejeonella sp.]MDP3468200.1 isopentenyl-diphosphate Delta-isomerase [Daejeonella sp.]
MKETFEGANELVILVDKQDNETGVQDKLSVHQLGLLHRAFSVFVFNSKHELILQQRADGKYHSPGLWTNTCCSHPKPGEMTIDACNRRLMEEMGMTCNLEFNFSFMYRCKFPNGLTEHEFDHVYVGKTDDLPLLNKMEVKNWRYVNLRDLEKEIESQPEKFTEWLKICFPKLLESIKCYPFKS